MTHNLWAMSYGVYNPENQTNFEILKISFISSTSLLRENQKKRFMTLVSKITALELINDIVYDLYFNRQVIKDSKTPLLSILLWTKRN